MTRGWLAPLFVATVSATAFPFALPDSGPDEGKPSPAERIAALEQMAASAAKADEAGRKATLEKLAEGLRDEEVDVRTRAITLLGASGAPDVGAPLLHRFCQEWDAEISELMEALEFGAPIPDVEDAMKGDRSRKRFERELEELGQELRRNEPAMDRIQVLSSLRDELANAFAALPHDASVEGLGLVLRHLHLGPEMDSALSALLTFGTRAALDRMLQVFERYEQELDRRKSREKAIKSSKLPAKNPFSIGSEADRRRRHEEDRARRLEDLHSEARALDAWMDGLIARIHTLADRHELSAPPSDGRSLNAWKMWMQRVGDALPQSLQP